MLGQEIFLDHGEEPSFSRQSIVDENTVFPGSIDFRENEYLQMVVGFYEEVKKRVGDEFNVLYPMNRSSVIFMGASITGIPAVISRNMYLKFTG